MQGESVPSIRKKILLKSDIMPFQKKKKKLSLQFHSLDSFTEDRALLLEDIFFVLLNMYLIF